MSGKTDTTETRRVRAARDRIKQLRQRGFVEATPQMARARIRLADALEAQARERYEKRERS